MDDLADEFHFNPGPHDPSVLWDQAYHRSELIWRSREDDNNDKMKLRCRRDDVVLHLHNDPQVEAVERFLDQAGFLSLYRLGYMKLDAGLITALVERWRPETHTFHGSTGEMTLTLQDIEILGGISVDGEAVWGTDVYKPGLGQDLLGEDPPEEMRDGNKVKITWLTETFNRLPANPTDFRLRCQARAVMLMLLGGRYLSDKTSCMTNLRYLHFMRDFDTCKQYSWGAAILANLYRELDKASYGDCANIGGALVILQVWAWTRFMHIRPIQRLAPFPENVNVGSFPYGYRWIAASHGYDPSGVSHSLKHYRDQFEMMREEEVVWEPYKDFLAPGRVEERLIWRARVPLICNCLITHYYPDRVMRQFGMTQRVPNAVAVDRDTFHVLHNMDYRSKKWDEKLAPYKQQWDNRLSFVVHSEPFLGVMSFNDPYMKWYRSITRLSICSMSHVRGDGYRPIAPVYRTLVDGLSRVFNMSLNLGVDQISQECRTLIRQVGIPEELLEEPPPAQIRRQRGRGRGGRAGRGRAQPDVHEGGDVQDQNAHPSHSQPNFNLLTPTQEDNPYIPEFVEDLEPPYMSADAGSSPPAQVPTDDHWVEALIEPPSIYVPAYDRVYERRRRTPNSSPSTSHQEIGESSSMQVDQETPQAPEPMQRQARNRRPPLCFTEQQRRRHH